MTCPNTSKMSTCSVCISSSKNTQSYTLLDQSLFNTNIVINAFNTIITYLLIPYILHSSLPTILITKYGDEKYTAWTRDTNKKDKKLPHLFNNHKAHIGRVIKQKMAK